MKTFCCAAVPLVVAQSNPAPLLTVAGTYEFATTSVAVTYNAAEFACENVYDAVKQRIPAHVISEAQTHVDTALAKVEALRVQHGLPSYSQVVADVKKEYEKRVAPAVEVAKVHFETAKVEAAKAKAKVDEFAKVPQQYVSHIVAKFEAAYPESKGVMPTNIYDFVWAVLFLYYAIWSYLFAPVLSFLLQVLCCIFTCGSCARRNKQQATAAAVARPNVKAVSASKKKK